MAAKIKKIVKHDSLSVKATYPNGEHIKFIVNRSGEKFEYASNHTLTAAQSGKLIAMFKFQTGETNINRIDRIASVFEQANAVTELV